MINVRALEGTLHLCMHVCGECWRVCNWSVCPGLGFHQLFIVPGHRKQCMPFPTSPFCIPRIRPGGLQAGDEKSPQILSHFSDEPPRPESNPWRQYDRPECYHYSLRKKFFSSQAQRADNRQNWEARKKLHKPELFFLPKHGRFWNFNMINLPYLLQWHPFVSLIKRICISAPVYILRKEFWFVLPYFLSLLSTILQAQSGLRSWNFTCPVRILQVSDIGLVLSFEDCH